MKIHPSEMTGLRLPHRHIWILINDGKNIRHSKKMVKMVGRHTMDSEEPSNIRNEFFSTGRIFCDSAFNKMTNACITIQPSTSSLPRIRFCSDYP